MNLVRVVEVREMVDKLCAAIDAGTVTPSEHEMFALAVIVDKEAGPLAFDLLCKLASRCRIGREALKDIAQ